MGKASASNLLTFNSAPLVSRKMGLNYELVIRLTIHLIKIGMDPFTFQFDFVEENKNGKSEDYEVVESTVVSASDGLSADSSSLSFSQNLPLLFGSNKNFIHKVCEEINVKDIDITNEELGSNSSHQTAGYAGLSTSLLALSADSFLVSSPQVLSALDGSNLHSSEAEGNILFSSWFADGVSAESLSTLPRYAGSAFASLTSSLSTSSSISMGTCLKEACFLF